MSESVSCPGCRSSVAIPADHVDPSIRCGICWTEIRLSDRPVPIPAPVVVSTPAAPPVPTVARRPAVALAGQSLPGMAKLEDLMRSAAARIAPPPKPVLATPIRATAASPPLVEIQPVVVAEAIEPDSRPIPVPAARDSMDRVEPDAPVPEPVRPPRSRPARRRPLEDFDDEIDDRPRRRPARPERSSAMPLVVGLFLFLALLIGGIYVLARSLRGKSDRDLVPIAEAGDPAIQLNPPDLNANPDPQFGFNPFPKLPNMQPPGMNPAMVDYQGDGYTAKTFGRPIEFPSFQNLYDDNYLVAHARSKSIRSNATPPSATIEIITADAPQGVTPDVKRMITESTFRRGEVKAGKLAGIDGFEHVDDFAGRHVTTRAVQVGCRVFIAKFTIMDAFGNRRAMETLRTEFFDSFKITFDAKTAAPVDPGLIMRRPNIPMPPRPPKPPGRP